MERERIRLLTYCVVFVLMSKNNLVLSQCDNRTAARIGQYPGCELFLRLLMLSRIILLSVVGGESRSEDL